MKEMSYLDKNTAAVNIFVQAVRKAIKNEADKIRISPSVSEEDRLKIRKMVDDMTDKLSRDLSARVR